jgi:hypothetical protein
LWEDALFDDCVAAQANSDNTGEVPAGGRRLCDRGRLLLDYVLFEIGMVMAHPRY